MKNKRNEDLEVTDYALEGSTGPWANIDRYGRRINSPLGAPGLIDFKWDYVEGTPNLDSPTSLTYKIGGSSGTTVATLTLTYSSGVLVSVEKT